MFRILLALFASSFLFMSCKTSLVPQYVKLDNISKLRTGMDKRQVLSNLGNVYPTEILNGTGNCEVHEYLYVRPQRSILNLSGVLDRDELMSGNMKYGIENKAVIVYRNKKLSQVYTVGGVEDMSELLNVQNNISLHCKNELTIIKGCMDPNSLNYNPDAIEDNGSCEYCECGMTPNPDFNPLRPISDCNARCIALGKSVSSEKEKCDECDLIEAISNSGASVTIKVGSGSSSSSKKTTPAQSLKIKSGKLAKAAKKIKVKAKKRTSKKPKKNQSEVQIIKVY